jgi:hypothetical protein
MSRILTIGQSYYSPEFFSDENVNFIQDKITKVINKDITTKVTIPKESIARIMFRVMSERLETIPKMNERVVMTCVNDYLVYQLSVSKHLNWADGYIQSQRLFDPTCRRGVIANWTVKTNPKKLSTAVRFHFT